MVRPIPAFGTRSNRVFGPHAFSTQAAGTSTAPSTVTFKALDGDSGTGNLPSSLTVNGATETPAISYLGAGAGASSWTADSGFGGGLAIAGTGADPLLSQLTPTTQTSDVAMSTQGGKAYQSASSSEGQVGTEDMVVELVVRGDAQPTNFCGTKLSVVSTAGAGWCVQQPNATQVRMLIRAAGTTFSATGSGSLGQWNVFHFFLDRDDATGNGFAVYVNGSFFTSVNPSSIAAQSLQGDSNFTVGAPGDLTTATGTNIALVRMWKRSNWFPGGATNATISAAVAKERMARYAGVYPSVALGTPTPLVMTRSSAAMIDIIDPSTFVRRLFPVGSNWPRLCSRRAVVSGLVVKGALIESTRTNLFQYSEELDQLAWNPTALAVTPNVLTAPTGAATMDAIIHDATTVQHRVFQTPTLSNAPYTQSVFATAGARNWLLIEDTTVANAKAWFDVTNGVVGTIGAGVGDAVIEPWGNGIFRCSIRFAGTVAAHTLNYSFTSADNVATDTGDSVTTTGYLWGAQIEQQETHGAYIATANTAASRSQDLLQYVGNDGNFVAGGPGTIQAVMLAQNYDQQSNGAIFSPTAGSATGLPDGASIAWSATGDVARGLVGSGGVAQMATNGTSDVFNGERRTLKLTWATNDGKLYVDGVQEGATDTVLTVPAAAPTIIQIGTQGPALVSSVQIDSAVV